MESSSSASASATVNNGVGDIHLYVDEFYLSALFDSEDGLLPVSDENYAYELHLQEALVSALCNNHTATLHYTNHSIASSSSSSSVLAASSSSSSSSLAASSSVAASNKSIAVCLICMDPQQPENLFANETICSHKFCTNCMATYLATKVQDNIALVQCPEIGCKGTLDPQTCRSILPQPVYERWEAALCESIILGAQKAYCPYKDCSAMLVDDGGVQVRSSECPHCRRLFCAWCKVPWHSGMGCEEFQATRSDGMGGEDLMAVELANKNNWRRCPKCFFYVEKVSGCKHITCRCKYEFCYGCGSKYTGAQCSC